jgi:hypothetical protein
MAMRPVCWVNYILMNIISLILQPSLYQFDPPSVFLNSVSPLQSASWRLDKQCNLFTLRPRDQWVEWRRTREDDILLTLICLLLWWSPPSFSSVYSIIRCSDMQLIVGPSSTLWTWLSLMTVTHSRCPPFLPCWCLVLKETHALVSI